MVRKKKGAPASEWALISFGDCLSTLGNNTLPRAALNYDEGAIKNIHYGDVLIKFPSVLDVQRERLPYINADVAYSIRSNFLQEGDVVIADTAEDETVGKAAEVRNLKDEKVVSGLHTIPCRPKDSDMFASKYLGYFINHSSFHDQIVPYITGIKVSSISKSSLEYAFISVPPKDEQEKIVEVLSDVDELILNLEKLIQKKAAIKQGAMQQLLSGERSLTGMSCNWHDVIVGDFCKVIGGGTPSTKIGKYWQGDIPWISSSDLHADDILNISISRLITSEAVANSATQVCPPNTVLVVSRVGVGKVAVAPCSICTSQDFTNLVVENYNPVFIAYKLIPEMRALSGMAQGTSIQGVAADDIRQLVIKVPDKEEQDQIVAVLEDMDNEIRSLRIALQKYKAIKTGMMNELLTGRVRLV